jgi:hypothetical protein
MTIKGVLWHSTGANNPNLKRYVQPSDKKPTADTYSKDKWLEVLGKNTNKNDMNHINREMGMNAWIGKLANGDVAAIQTMPWNFKPWGCSSGKNGSCNNGWIQFEICEDNLGDKKYFEAIYKEACELTAYLCKTNNLDPKGTVKMNGVSVPVILCHADSNKLGLGSNHGDVYHWFKKYGKDMDDVRNDVAKLIDAATIKPAEKKEEPAKKEEAKYFVRKTWKDAKSQVGAFASLDNAKKACDKAGVDYEVYDSKGVAIYPDCLEESKEFKVGDKVKILTGSTWSTGDRIPVWVFPKTLYVREIRKNGIILVSILPSGAITGTVKPNCLVPLETKVTNEPVKPKINPYLVLITASTLNVRAGAGTNYRVATTVKKGQAFTIVDEKNGWGKLKSGAGWIDLRYTKKLK